MTRFPYYSVSKRAILVESARNMEIVNHYGV